MNPRTVLFHELVNKQFKGPTRKPFQVGFLHDTIDKQVIREEKLGFVLFCFSVLFISTHKTLLLT